MINDDIKIPLMRDTKPKLLYNIAGAYDSGRRELIENAYILIGTRGRIDHVGSGEPPLDKGFEKHDMKGSYALPGIVDGHCHISLPLNYEPARIIHTYFNHKDQLEKNVRSALSAGVTCCTRWNSFRNMMQVF